MKTQEPLQTLCEGKYLRLLKRGRWEYAERTNSRGAAVIAAVTPEGRLLLVEQVRAALGKAVIELPAGLVGDEAQFAAEGFATAAARELREETGYDTAEVHAVFTGVPSAGISNEMITIFVATGLKRVSSQLGDGAEEITLHEVPLAEVDAWLAAKAAGGAVIDVKVYAGLYFLGRQQAR